MKNLDIQTYKIYFVGLYLYNIYKIYINPGFRITGDDPSIFYFTLGFHIQQTYSNIFNDIFDLISLDLLNLDLLNHESNIVA